VGDLDLSDMAYVAGQHAPSEPALESSHAGDYLDPNFLQSVLYAGGAQPAIFMVRNDPRVRFKEAEDLLFRGL